MEAGSAFYNQTWERFSRLLAKHVPSRPSLCSRSPPEDETATVDSDQLECARSEVIRLFNKQEYFRQAYNTTLMRMDALASMLPPHAMSHLPVLSTLPVGPRYAEDKIQKCGKLVDQSNEYGLPSEHDVEEQEDEKEEDNIADDENYDEYDDDMGAEEYEEEEEEDIDLSPEMVEFMMQTIKHREERDRLKNSPNQLTEPQLHKAPPPKANSSFKSPPQNESPIQTEIRQIETALLHQYEYCSVSRDAPFWPFVSLRN